MKEAPDFWVYIYGSIAGVCSSSPARTSFGFPHLPDTEKRLEKIDVILQTGSE
jgi:hypothetical protein